MNAAVANKIQQNREAARRTIIADRNEMTGITSDGQHVEFDRNGWCWRNVDTFQVVKHSGIVWTENE